MDAADAQSLNDIIKSFNNIYEMSCSTK